jgi:sec-independent protein translocase protein TatB
MFLDIAPSEFLLTAIVAVVVIGPKDLPRAMRTAGRWMGQMRRISGHFRSGIETMIREAELEDMEKKWREQNEAIMQANPPAMTALPAEVTAVAPTAPLAPGEHEATLLNDTHTGVGHLDVGHQHAVHQDTPPAPGEPQHAAPAQRADHPHPDILS